MQHAKSRSDVIYRRFIVSTFFANGWGDLNAFKRLLELRELLGNRSTSYQLVSRCHPVQLQRSWSQESHFVAEGQFTSPVAAHAPHLLPRESEQAYFQVIVPKIWHRKDRKPLCLHLAGTGDHFFWRRRNLMAKPLAKESGIASIILESPFYGLRKPKGQTRSSLRHVLDLFVMGAALMLEALVLFHWSEREGFGPLGVSGVSMGGHMASLAATTWPKPLAIIPCLSWSTASCVFTQGVMRHSCAWDKLEQQLCDKSYRQTFMDLVSPDGSAEHIFQDNADGILQNYPGAGFSTVPVETRDSTKQHSYYQHLQANHEDISKALYFSKEHPEGEPKENVFQNFPGILKPAKGKVFGSPPSRAVRCMDFVMDKVTHLDNLQKPCDPSLAKFVVAEHDAYVPRNNVAHLQDVWPGCQVDYIDSGHVAGSLVHQAKFRKAITQMMNKL